ncbi:Protein NRT1/ PTR FAMILY 8.1, partial [Mucuna pruriens]
MALIADFGMIILTFSAAGLRLRPSIDATCCHPTSVQTAACFIGFYLIAPGTGGIKSWASSLGAGQFDENYNIERKEKSSFLNWHISQLVLEHYLLPPC